MSVRFVTAACVVVWLGMTAIVAANDELLAEAQEELQFGEYANAQKWFEKLLEENGEDVDFAVPAFLGLSRVHHEQGRYAAARDVIKDGTDQFPDVSSLWARLAELCFHTGDYEQAIQAVRKALDLDSQNLQALLVRAHLHAEAGEIDEALAEYRSFVRIYNRLQPTEWQTLLTIGQGAAVYARWESVSPIFRFLVNTLCPDALRDNPDCWQAYLLSGTLLLEKYNAGQALPELNAALEINPYCSDALVAMATAALQDSKLELAEEFADRALTPNPQHLDALLVKGMVRLLAEDESGAMQFVEQAMQVNPRHQAALGLAAAVSILDRIDVTAQSYEELLRRIPPEPVPGTESFSDIWSELIERNPRPGVFLETVGSVLDARRKYEHAEVFYLKAIELMPQLSGPKTSLGMLYMRSGRIEEAEEILDQAFAADPFHVRVSNMRKVLGVLKSYETIATDHFVVRAAGTDHLLAKMVADYLEEIYPELTLRYQYEPPVRSQFEIYSESKDQSGHAWFSARMIGLPWIQTVGASTGKIVAMTSPDEAENNFNWMRVIRHEFVHVLTLQKTDFNIPHWFTEAISVTEENRQMPVEWQLLLLERFDADRLFDLSTVNEGFQKPQDANDWTLAYCQSYLYAEYMQQEFGEDALTRLLAEYCTTTKTPLAIQQAFNVSIQDFEQGYREHLEAIVRAVRRKRSPQRLSFREAQGRVENQPDDAAAHAQLALSMIRAIGYEQPTLDALNRALELEPTEPLAVALLANYHLRNDDDEQALELLQQAGNGSTQEPVYLRVQAAAYRRANRMDEAIEVLNYAINRFPLEDGFYDDLLEIYDDTKVDADKLEALLVELAARDYDDIPSRKRLARLAASTDDNAAAIRWAREALAVDVRDPEMHQILAEHLRTSGETAAAIRAYENLMLLDRVPIESRLNFAKLLRKAGQHERSASVLRRLLNDTPDHAEAMALLKIVEQGL